MGQRVVIHVGCPKTGSTGIQGQLYANWETLTEQGILYPCWRHDAQFLAALDMMDQSWPGHAGIDRVGVWDQMLELIDETDLDVLLSHELLARATPEHIKRAVDSLGDAEVSVIITARDLGRVIPAEYQEHVKYLNPMKFGDFLTRLQEPDVDDQPGVWARLTWLVQDVPALAERWASVVGVDHVTIVTVPGRGAPRDELMKRFGQAVGFDPRGFVPSESIANRSLGAAEVEVLRRFNLKEGLELSEHAYHLFARNRLIRGLESRVGGAPPLSLTDRDYPWVRALAEQWVEHLANTGYRVVGDLQELLPQEPSPEAIHPDDVAMEQLFGTALGFLARNAAHYSELDILKVEQEEEIAELEFLLTHPVERFKRRVVAWLETSGLGQGILRIWRMRPGYVPPESEEE